MGFIFISKLKYDAYTLFATAIYKDYSSQSTLTKIKRKNSFNKAPKRV